MQPKIIFSDDELTRIRAQGHYRDLFKRKRNNSKNLKGSSLEELNSFSRKTSNVLLDVKSFFPFDFFPDEVCVEIHRVNVIKRNFFLSERVHGIPIANILDVFTEHGPIFATLKIIDSGFVEQEIYVNYLKRGDAEKARELIQGLIDAKKQGIELTGLDSPEVKKILIKLGSISSETVN